MNGIREIRVLGGEKTFHLLTRELEKESEKKYNVSKAIAWMSLLQDNMQPTKWKRPTKAGTSVRFVMITTQEQMDKACEEYGAFFEEKLRQYKPLEENGDE